MRIPKLACAALLLGSALVPRSAWTQGTKDQARLIFTVSAGTVLGKPLWSIAKQPVQLTTPPDTFALGRRVRSTIAIGFSGIYYPGDHLGVGVEGFLIGLGFEDSCRLAFSSGSGDAATACLSIQGANKSATAVALTVGPVLRAASQSLISPYARANVGVVFSSQSSIRTVGRYPTPDGFSDLIVYDDDHQSRVEPILGLGAGFTAAVSPSYQLRWEVRDNITGIQKISAATPEARVIPPHKVTYKHLFSLTIGFDVVLERKRGRRY
jgi:hypothetical protein